MATISRALNVTPFNNTSSFSHAVSLFALLPQNSYETLAQFPDVVPYPDAI